MEDILAERLVSLLTINFIFLNIFQTDLCVPLNYVIKHDSEEWFKTETSCLKLNLDDWSCKLSGKSTSTRVSLASRNKGCCFAGRFFISHPPKDIFPSNPSLTCNKLLQRFLFLPTLFNLFSFKSLVLIGTQVCQGFSGPVHTMPDSLSFSVHMTTLLSAPPTGPKQCLLLKQLPLDS